MQEAAAAAIQIATRNAEAAIAQGATKEEAAEVFAATIVKVRDYLRTSVTDRLYPTAA